MRILIALFVIGISVASLDGIADNIQPPRLWWWGAVLVVLSLVWLFGKNKVPAVPLRSLAGAWGLFAMTGLIALLFSAHPVEGLFDSLRNLLFFFTLLYLAHWLKSDRKNIGWASLMATLAILISIVAGLFQWAFLPETNTPAEYFLRLYQITGLTGHKTTLAALMLMGLPFSLWLAASTKGIQRVLGVLAALGAVGLVLFLQSRAAWLALLVFLSVAGVFFLRYRGSGFLGKKQVAALLAVALLGIGAFWFLKGSQPDEVFDYQKSGIVQMDSERNAFRLSIWQSTLSLWAGHPVLGVGPGQWRTEIPPYQTDHLLRKVKENEEPRFQTWHRPHNDFLWVASEKGAVGLVAYLFFWGLLMAVLAHWFLKKNNHPDYPLVALLGGMFGAYLVMAFVSFPSERLDLQVFFLLAVAVLMALNDTGTTSRWTLPGGKWVPITALLAGALAVVYATASIQVAKTHAQFLEAKVRLPLDKAGGDWERKLTSPFVKLDPFALPYTYYLGVSDMRARSFGTARVFYEKALRQHPNHLEVRTASALLYFYQKDYEKCLAEADRALAIFPNHQNALVVKAKSHYALKQYDEAQQALSLCVAKIKKSLIDGGMVLPEKKNKQENGK